MMKMRVIKTEQQNEEALARIEALMELEPIPDVVDELELLSTLVELYEDAAYPSPFLDPINAFQFGMEQQKLRQKDLVAYLGSKSKVSEVLSSKRPLSLGMVRRLHEGLGIPQETLLAQDAPPLERVAAASPTYRTQRDAR